MKKYILILIIVCNIIYAQEMKHPKTGKLLKATAEWSFNCEQYAYSGNLNVQVSKTETGGILKLSTKVSQKELYIGDRVFLMLEGADLVYCTDKGLYTYEDNIATTYYLLTPKEMLLLSKKTITDVRFKIIGKPSKFGSQTGFFTAFNSLTVYDKFTENAKTIDTKTEIKNLN